MNGKRRSQTLLDFFQKKKTKTNEDTSDEGGNIDAVIDSQPSTSGVVVTTVADQSDISSFRNKNKQLNDGDKIKILQGLSAPQKKFEFPSTTFGNKSRKFQYDWLENYKWLIYSKSEDGAYCKYCFIFSQKEVGHNSGQITGHLVSDPYRNWKKALESFQKHQTTQYHRAASIKADNFLAVMAGESQSIDSQVDSVRTRQIQENQEKLAPIIKTVILCGRQGLPLRGHRDHGEFNVSVEPEENEGNFRALLRARIDSGDVNLKKHFETCPRNATYISWNIQNQIIEACDIIIKRKIASEVNSSKCLSILADETTDISTIEQCSICVRYVKNIGTSHNQFTICENFLTFVPIKSTCGKDLADAIINELILCNIDVSNLRGQGYDGASNMSGHLKGTQACIAKDHPTALYVHCAAHNLNLAISSASGIPPIRNCMGTIEKVYTFFNTPKRQQVLQHQVQLLFPESRRDRMKQMCPTRWIQRHDSVMVMVQLLKPVHSALQEISLWKDKESSSGAFVLLSALAQSQFVISLFSVEKLLGYSLPLSKILQLENSDLAFAMDNAEETISCQIRARQC